MKNWIRFIFKAILYAWTIVYGKMCTGVFKFSLVLNGVRYGRGLKCFNSVPVLLINRHSGLVTIGNNVIFNSYTGHSWYSKCKLVVLGNASLSIGDNSGMNGVMVYCSQEIRIGKYVKIGGGTRITDSNHHSLDYKTRRTSEDFKCVKSAPVIIGDDVFIGANCYIGKGVSIGDRSIVAAGSVVVKSIQADEIWGGNPAKFIKKINL